MTAILGILSVCLLAAWIGERRRRRGIQKEICYLTGRLRGLSVMSENGFVLLPTDHACVKELAAAVNGLLEDFYKGKGEYAQSKREMARMLTNISHDIRTPLTVLRGNSEMLAARAGQLGLPPEVEEMAEKLERKASQLAETVNDYFTLSKVSSGDLAVKSRRTDIARLCRDTVLDYYDLLESRRFTVDVRIPDAPVFGETDSDMLRRILKNLIDNGIRHGGDGKYLGLRLSAGEDHCRIQVEDHGKGIPMRQQEQIFERNYTAAGGTAGSGLGLAIARGLARRLGGDLKVESIPGEKTIFSVTIKR